MSIADLSLLATLDPADHLEVDLTPYPHLKAWRDARRSEPFYKHVHNHYGEEIGL